MTRILHRTGRFFLIFAALIFNAHMMIPHDHHLSDSNFLEEHCPASNSETGHHRGLPLHCHAFNDLASEKALNFTALNYVQNGHSALFFIPDIEVYFIQARWLRICDFSKHTIDSGISDLSYLRAPPFRG